MEFYSYKDLIETSKKFYNVVTINSRTRQIYLKLKYERLKKELQEVEKAYLWEVLKNGR